MNTTTATTEILSTTNTVKRGRPVLPTSKRQERLTSRLSKIEAGLPIQKGRPVNSNSARQTKIQERTAKTIAGYTITRGRPKSTTTPIA